MKKEIRLRDLCFGLYDASPMRTDAFEAVLVVLEDLRPRRNGGKTQHMIALPAEEAGLISATGKEPVKKDRMAGPSLATGGQKSMTLMKRKTSRKRRFLSPA